MYVGLNSFPISFELTQWDNEGGDWAWYRGDAWMLSGMTRSTEHPSGAEQLEGKI